MGHSLTLMTYNILEPNLAEEWKIALGLDPDTGKSNWNTRRHQVAANIVKAQPDILLLQEVSPTALPELPEGMELSPLSLHPGSPNLPYGCAIAFNAKRFRSSAYTFFNQDKTRAATIDGLWDREVGRMHFVCSSHLKGYGPYETDPLKLQAEALPGNCELWRQLDHLDEYTGQQLTLVGGDFNMDPAQHDDRAQLMQKYNYLTTPRRVTELSSGREIDFIYVHGTAQKNISEPEVTWPYPLASDHLPRVMRVELE